jgi:transcriptional regulator with XRE-family HTH domain
MRRQERTAQDISKKVRLLREHRHWTQTQLARELGMSQGRLSEVERGGGSFTAEQFLAILRIFNVGVSYFTGLPVRADEDALQNALARLGARHLRESDAVVPDERLDDPGRVIRHALVAGSPRAITALGPVLVELIDDINLWKVHLDVTAAGLERRFAWVVDNLVQALHHELQRASLSRVWARRYRHAVFLLDSYLQHVKRRGTRVAEGDDGPPDILDPEIRSAQTLQLVRDEAAATARAWGVVTRLRLEDFVDALGASRGAV